MEKLSMLTLVKVLINIVVFCLTLYLVIQEFYGYILKPTHSSKFEEEFNSKYYPVFYVCPKTGFNIDKLKYHGYSSSLDYHQGSHILENSKNEDEVFKGWSGNMSEDPELVINEISTFTNEDDCPKTRMLIDNNFPTIPMKLTRATFPLGRCCRADMVSHVTPQNILFHFPKNKTIDKDGFRLFITDKNSATDFEINQMKISGQEIECNNQEVSLYKIKISSVVNLDNDPKLKCRNYELGESFHQVFQNSFYYYMKH